MSAPVPPVTYEVDLTSRRADTEIWTVTMPADTDVTDWSDAHWIATLTDPVPGIYTELRDEYRDYDPHRTINRVTGPEPQSPRTVFDEAVNALTRAIATRDPARIHAARAAMHTATDGLNP